MALLTSLLHYRNIWTSKYLNQKTPSPSFQPTNSDELVQPLEELKLAVPRWGKLEQGGGCDLHELQPAATLE